MEVKNRVDASTVLKGVWCSYNDHCTTIPTV